MNEQALHIDQSIFNESVKRTNHMFYSIYVTCCRLHEQKKTMLPQGNRAMPKLFFSVQSSPKIKQGFRAPNILAHCIVDRCCV